jgi:pyrimidine-nucleoside phosphorylase
MRAVDIIDSKRRGEEHAPEEIRRLVSGYVDGTIPDYQMSAWLMAVLWRGLTDDETFALTGAMVDSGDVLDLSGIPGHPVDKHSTGGIGDKTTLAVVPILASAGVPVAKMSGRGLGYTGGTLDKLESLPGMRVRLSVDEILAQVRSVGACLCAQTERLVPADKKIYALRDATATVESIPLVAASVMSKKIAGGSPAILLDVKAGSGAFMKNVDEARRLAELMVKIGARHGRRVAAVLTDMNSPLGAAVGNLVEVREVSRLLQNDPGTDERLRELTRFLAGAGFLIGGRVQTLDEGQALADAQIASGAAFAKLGEIVRAQGGDPSDLDDTSPPPAGIARDVKAGRSGFIGRIDALAIGGAAMRLGAGRPAKEDSIDPAAGIILRKTAGAPVAAGDVLATLYTNDADAAAPAERLISDAFALSSEPPRESPALIIETMGL